MKKIVILGCENSHANAFLDNIRKQPTLSHIEVIGVYSDEREAAEKLHEQFGVPVMERYDEAVGKVDGVVITARHGGSHYKFAKPYIASGVPMFVDKPITVSEDEAVEFMSVLKEKGIKLTGGSCLRYDFTVQQAKQAHEQQLGGRTVGGAFRAPLSIDNPHGGFFFYSQHLVEMVLEAFGRFPKAVQVSPSKNAYTVLFHYEDFTVTGLYTVGSGDYYAVRFGVESSQGGSVEAKLLHTLYYTEFKHLVDLIDGGEMDLSYEEIFAPVFVLNAINRGITSGKLEPVNYPKA